MDTGEEYKADFEQQERWYREECLEVWRQWVCWNRPDPDSWCKLKGFVPRTGMDPDDGCYVTWARFDISMACGGYDEDGCENGAHPWTRPRPRGFHWAVLRELLRHRNIATYWYHLIHVPSAAEAAPLTQQQAFEADGF